MLAPLFNFAFTRNSGHATAMTASCDLKCADGRKAGGVRVEEGGRAILIDKQSIWQTRDETRQNWAVVGQYLTWNTGIKHAPILQKEAYCPPRQLSFNQSQSTFIFPGRGVLIISAMLL